MREIRPSGSMSGEWKRLRPRHSSTLLMGYPLFKYIMCAGRSVAAGESLILLVFAHVSEILLFPTHHGKQMVSFRFLGSLAWPAHFKVQSLQKVRD